jgi:cytochrome c biogenesis protein CcmG/thiol:disulfide interchange protein DsbE
MVIGQPRWTTRGIAAFAATVLVAGSLLVLLWVRLLAAHQATQALFGSPLVGHRAPDFALTLYNGYGATAPGQRLRLADLRGKVVLVNFWASWCQPCLEEVPIVEQAWKQYRSQGLVVVGVDYEDQSSAARAFLQQQGITYPTGPDAADGAIAIAYGVTGTPESAFIDRSGVVAQKVGGALDDGTLQKTVEALLRAKG